jgi:DNA-binding PadR family transcriptional regulator
MTMPSPLASLGRFARPAQQIVTVLAAGPRTPPRIRHEVGARCGVDIGPGTLFGALARLERRGLVEAMPADRAPRSYRLTALGATTLEAELGALADARTASRGPAASLSPAR